MTAAFTGGNQSASLAGTGLGIRCPKGKSVPTFRNRPLPEIACKLRNLARLVPYVLSSKGAKKFPKGKLWQFLYTGMTSNGPGRVLGGAISRRDARLLALGSCVRWKAPARRRLAKVVVAVRKG